MLFIPNVFKTHSLISKKTHLKNTSSISMKQIKIVMLLKDGTFSDYAVKRWSISKFVE